MKIVNKPKVFLISEPRIIQNELDDFLIHIGVPNWKSDAESDAEYTIEIGGRICYNSFEPDINKNVKKVRKGNNVYIKNLIESRHGSCLENSSISFIFSDLSRICIMELIRHRAGTGMSQESGRYCRYDEILSSIPSCISTNKQGEELYMKTIEEVEKKYLELVKVYDLDNTINFHDKKIITSALRRILPEGQLTRLMWSCNFRSLRHIIELRTHPSAEEEIRLLFSIVYDKVKDKFPAIFQDYEVEIVDGIPWVKTKNTKI